MEFHFEVYKILKGNGIPVEVFQILKDDAVKVLHSICQQIWKRLVFIPLPKAMPKIIQVQFSSSVMSNSLRPHGLQHIRLPCPSPTPEAYSNSCPLSWWCHPTISSSVVPFSYSLQSFPASGSFPMSQFFPSGGQSFGASASASDLPVNTQDWFPFGLTGGISFI